MGWEHEMAQMIKSAGEHAKEKAIEDASVSIGTIEQVNPLKISTLGGEGMYEEDDDEIVQSRTFLRLSNDIKKKGAKVIVMPIDDLNTIAVLDVVEGG